VSDYDAGICETVGTGRLVSLDPEDAARDLLKKTAQEHASPVDLAPILRRLELKQVEADLEGDGYLLHLPSGRYEILVRHAETANLNRQRFTIGHELGHFLSERLAATKDGQPMKFKVEDAPQKKVENWCDTFASSLLMPAGAVHRVIGGPNGLFDANRIEEAANKFQVSLEAFSYRAAHLFRAALATTDAEATRIHRLSPKYLDTERHRAMVLTALNQRLREGKASARMISGQTMRFDGKRRVVFGWRSQRQ